MVFEIHSRPQTPLYLKASPGSPAQLEHLTQSSQSLGNICPKKNQTTGLTYIYTIWHIHTGYTKLIPQWFLPAQQQQQQQQKPSAVSATVCWDTLNPTTGQNPPCQSTPKSGDGSFVTLLKDTSFGSMYGGVIASPSSETKTTVVDGLVITQITFAQLHYM